MNINTITPVLQRSWQPLTFGEWGYSNPRQQEKRGNSRETSQQFETRRSRQVADAQTAEDARRRAAEQRRD